MIVQVVIISFLFYVDLMCFRFDFFPRVIISFKSQVPDLKRNSPLAFESFSPLVMLRTALGESLLKGAKRAGKNNKSAFLFHLVPRKKKDGALLVSQSSIATRYESQLLFSISEAACFVCAGSLNADER